MKRAWILALGLFALPVACADGSAGFGSSPDASTDSGRLDGASPRDGSVLPVDAAKEDAKDDAGRDATGPFDSGEPDGASPEDAGNPEDAGPDPVDSGVDSGPTPMDSGRSDAAVDSGRDAAVDSGPPPRTYFLGDPCGFNGLTCPAGWTCTKTDAASAEGFCTRECRSDADCRQGYSGSGKPECILSGNNKDYCAFACSDFNTTCPVTNLVCKDLSGDGDKDTCVEKR
jgi:hypothetical protein